MIQFQYLQSLQIQCFHFLQELSPLATQKTHVILAGGTQMAAIALANPLGYDAKKTAIAYNLLRI